MSISRESRDEEKPPEYNDSPSNDEALAVVVVTYSPGNTLETFVDTLQHATERQCYVILADNGSTDGAPERVARRPNVVVLPTGGNLGYGRAANLGATKASGEWFVLANPDIRWQRGALDELLRAAERWPRAAALGPSIRTSDGKLYPSARALPSLGQGIGHACFGWFWPSNPWTVTYRRYRGELTEEAVGWLSGSCLLLRRQAFDEIGGFDPGYFMYFEDVDLCERFGNRGWQNVYVPTAIVEHVGGDATRKCKPAMITAHHDSAYRYLSRRYSRPYQLPLRLALRAGLAGRAALARRFDRMGGNAQALHSANNVQKLSDHREPEQP